MKVKKDTLIKIKGSISVTNSIYYMNGHSYRRPPYSWSWSGNPVLSIKGIMIPTKIIIGTQNRYDQQPFNQIGISPRYKWITLHLGYRNLHFSPFTLAGHTFLGTGLELNPGKWKMAFMYGRMRKAILEDPLQPFQIQATYKRIGYGGYAGYGNNNNFIAFSFFKARDDTALIENNTPNTNDRLSPADNLVASIQSKLQIGKKNNKRKLIWETAWAASAHNSDYRSQPIATSKLGLWKPFTGIFKPTHSLRLATAGQTSLLFKWKDFSTRMQYRRIDPDYISMGAYFFLTDMESFTLEPSWKASNKKLNIQSSLGLQRNNLTQQRQAVTRRTIGSLNISFIPSQKYTLDVQLSNYGIAQQTGRNPLNDTTRMVQANTNISISNRYLSIKEGKVQSAILILNYQQVSDLNAITASMNNSRIFFFNLTYDHVRIPAGLTMNTAIHYTLFNSYAGKTLLSGITGGITKTIMPNKLTYRNTASIFSSVYHPNGTFAANGQRSKIATLNSGVQYKINRHHQWNGDVSCIFNWAATNQSFSEITGRLGYTYNF